MNAATTDIRFTAMGGPCLLRVDSQYADIESLETRVRAEVERLEQRYSRYRPDSLLSRINREAGSGVAIAIDEEAAALLRYIDTLWRQSSGVFDPTSGILRKSWDFTGDAIPEQRELDVILPLVGWDKVRWDAESVSLTRSGMQLDLGGVVKEYAVDCVVKLLREAGVENAVFDMAGDLYVIGKPSQRQGWPVSIRHPRNTGALCTLDLTDIALASSGDYERFIDRDGRRYGHLLDPRTGWPVEGLLCASVLAPQCLVAGSAATVALLKPADEGMAWLEGLQLPWIAVDADMKVHGPLREPRATTTA